MIRAKEAEDRKENQEHLKQQEDNIHTLLYGAIGDGAGMVRPRRPSKGEKGTNTCAGDRNVQ